MTRRDRVSALFAGGDFFVIFEYFFGLAFSALLPLLDATNQPTNQLTTAAPVAPAAPATTVVVVGTTSSSCACCGVLLCNT
jgi:hypothetical protein